MLVAAGVDVTPIGAGQRTALHTAADYGPDDPDLAGVLLGAGCDPAVENKHGRTALWLAQPNRGTNGKPRMAALLEAAAADPEATLAPYRGEVATLRRMVADWGLAAALECAPLLAVDRLGRADKSLVSTATCRVWTSSQRRDEFPKMARPACFAVDSLSHGRSGRDARASASPGA
eukprot:COSAG04_NODE_291_length_17813_cov_32.336231_8_plen_176_part_00